MSERIEATARALYEHNESESVEAGAAFISMPTDEYDCCAKAALAAADAVMFSDEAVERAAKAMFPTYWEAEFYHEHAVNLGRQMEESQRECIDHVRAVIAALRDSEKAS